MARDYDVEWCVLHKTHETIPACEPEPDFETPEWDYDPYSDDFNNGDGDE